MIESELFGHERGAFSDARERKLGLVEVADGGTLFLDEVGDLGPAAQAKLLTFLEQRTFRRVGATSTRSVDVRIVAATNRDLREMVAARTFREDLWYRLSAITLRVPPLREHADDVAPLAQAFLADASRQYRRRWRGISDETLRLLRSYSWPGNVRELRAVMGRAALLHDDEVLRPEHLPAEIGAAVLTAAAPAGRLPLELRRRRPRSPRSEVVELAPTSAACWSCATVTARWPRSTWTSRGRRWPASWGAAPGGERPKARADARRGEVSAASGLAGRCDRGYIADFRDLSLDRTDADHIDLERSGNQGGRARAIQALPFTTAAGFAAAVVALILISVLSYRSVQEWNRATARTSHTIAVLDAVDGVMAALTDAETSQRGYLLTGEERYLQLYCSTGGRLDQSLAALRRPDQRADDAMRRGQVEAIERAAGEKSAELRQTVELRRAGKVNEALQIVLTDRGKNVMDRLRAMLGSVRADEERILDERGRESQRAAATATTIIIAGAAALLFLFWGASLLTARDFRMRARESWLRTGQSGLDAAVQGDPRLETLGDRLLAVLAREVGAQVGAIFLADGDGGTFRRFAGYGLRASGGETPDVLPRDGLSAQAAKENRVIEVHDLPDGYLRVASSLGHAQPRHLLIAPAAADGVVQAVLELGFLRRADGARP